jgi:hypothetical protein
MKRTIIAATVILTLLGVVVFLLSDRRQRPRFVSSHVPAYAPGRVLSFASHPPQIADGKLWLSTWLGTNDFHAFLFDIAQRRIVGRLLNAAPLALNSNATKVLCLQRKYHTPGFVHEARVFVEEVLLHKTSAAWDVEVLWILDLADNSAVKIGALRRPVGMTTHSVPSPDFRHVLLRSAGGGNTGMDAYLCDLEEKTLRNITTSGVTGWPYGWWNERQILVLSGGGYDVYDIYTKQTSPLLTEAQMASALEANGFSPKLTGTARFFMPRGIGADIYLAPAQSDREQRNPQLLKFDRTNGTLSLVSRRFNPNWIGVLDPSDRYFLFSKRGAGGIYLHDFQADEVRTLVPPDNNPYWYRSFFRGDNVLYARSNSLWQIDFRGSNNVLLFPPPK